MDENLSWKIHIDNINKIISRNIGIINKLKSYFPPSTLLMLVFHNDPTIFELRHSYLGGTQTNI